MAKHSVNGKGDCFVLVVDDNKDAADSMKTLLESFIAGTKVAVAYSGEQALSVASKFRPDLALIDLRMPKMDGFSLREKLVGLYPECRTYALSGFGDEAMVQRSIQAGFHQHLVKPVDPMLIKLIVEQECERNVCAKESSLQEEEQ